MTADAAIPEAILALTTAAGPGKSICPTEVARALEPEEAAWRPLMGRIRRAALALQAEGRIDILRKGKPVAADAVRGVIRLRRHQEA